MKKEEAIKMAFRAIEIKYIQYGKETILSLWHNTEDHIVGECVGDYLQEKANEQTLSEVTPEMICEFVMEKYPIIVYSEQDWKILKWIIHQPINIC